MRLTITTLVIVEGNTIQGIYHSLEEHPGKAYHYDQIQREVQTEILHQLEISNLLEQLKNN